MAQKGIVPASDHVENDQTAENDGTQPGGHCERFSVHFGVPLAPVVPASVGNLHP